jgi:transposase
MWQCVACLKRLEKGTFRWPQGAGEPDTKLRLARQALQLLLDGRGPEGRRPTRLARKSGLGERLAKEVEDRLDILLGHASEDATG